ncbi:hypothetical protein Efla_001276 [Eimeria flavescens]
MTPQLPLKEGGSVVSGQLTLDSSAMSGELPWPGAVPGAPLAGRGEQAPSAEGGSAAGGAGLLLGPLSEMFRGSAHPGICFFHLLFKCLSLFTFVYLLALLHVSCTRLLFLTVTTAVQAASSYCPQFCPLFVFRYFFGSFLFGSYRGDADFVVTFVLTLVLLSLDFWTVKNVSGRKLVGLCWRQRVAADGSAKWVFQKAAAYRRAASLDFRVFWGGVVVWALMWVAFWINTIVTLDLLWYHLAAQ